MMTARRKKVIAEAPQGFLGGGDYLHEEFMANPF
jgi:hypothetical protein